MPPIIVLFLTLSPLIAIKNKMKDEYGCTFPFVDNYKSTGKGSTVTSALVNYGYSMTQAGELFKKVADSGTGIEVSYDYCISNVSSCLVT